MNDLILHLLSNGGVLALNIQEIALAGAVVGGAGLIIGVLLGIAGKAFEVEVDERVTEVRDQLPGSNCGGCGFAGCDALAEAIVAGDAPVNACPAGANHAAIADIMGSSVGEGEKYIAFVHCGGTCDKTEVKYIYHGIADCKKLALIPGHGEKVCSYGCMGYGTCVRECKFDAIHIVNGVAVVDKEKCVGCSACIKACPNHIIDLVPESATHLVSCNSNAKGKEVKAGCSVGCIGCGICVKQCEAGAIVVENNLAKIDYSKCTHCGKCAAKCPQKIITGV